MSGNSSKRNNGYVARSSGSGMNKSSGGKGKGKRSRKMLGFDMSDTESRIAFWAFIVVSVLMLALLIAGFGLGISRCVSGGEAPENETGEVMQVDDLVSYADGVAEVSAADIISETSVG